MENGKNGQRQLPPINGLSHLNDTALACASAVIILDRTACVTDWNDEAVRLFGYSAKAAIGKSFYHFLDLESLAAGSIEWELLTAYYRGTSTCNRQYMHQNGSHFRATAEVMPLWDDHFLGYRLSFGSPDHTQTTQRKRADEWLE